MSGRKTLTTLMGILRELQYLLPKGQYKTDPSYKFVLSRYRRYQVTPEKLCRSSEAAYHQASTYQCYLQSNRTHQELIRAYQGKGERSIEDSASLVGLKLPEVPED